MSSATHLRLGTRGSPLALFQAHAVADRLQEQTGVGCEIVIIKTSGDRLADAPLADVGGKRLFVKEIEDALAEGAIDLAVHSSKDMPAALVPGLAIGAVLPREDARDALVLPAGAVPVPSAGDGGVTLLRGLERIGTGSIRRVAQLARLAPLERFLPIRGNLGTRLRKLDEGEFDALVLAAAGLKRLGHTDRIAALLPIDLCIPAPGQGIVAVEIRRDDQKTGALVGAIDHAPSRAALDAERAVVSELGGGCQMPIGAHATVSDGAVALVATVVSRDGRHALRVETRGDVGQPNVVGADAAAQLLAGGARAILDDAGGPSHPSNDSAE